MIPIRGRNSRSLREVHSANVDLTPIMCLFIILVPLLLLTAVFERLAVLKAHLPEASTLRGPATDESARPSGIVELRLMIRPQGLELQGTLSHEPDGTEKETYEDFQVSFPLVGDRYDLDGLQKHLKSLKNLYPRHEKIVFLVEDKVTYDIIVQAMDACREEIFEDAGREVRRPLFPSISISEAFREDGVYEGLRQGTRELDEKLGSQ